MQVELISDMSAEREIKELARGLDQTHLPQLFFPKCVEIFTVEVRNCLVNVVCLKKSMELHMRACSSKLALLVCMKTLKSTTLHIDV